MVFNMFYRIVVKKYQQQSQPQSFFIGYTLRISSEELAYVPSEAPIVMEHYDILLDEERPLIQLSRDIFQQTPLFINQ
jgi:hypothetical protein